MKKLKRKGYLISGFLIMNSFFVLSIAASCDVHIKTDGGGTGGSNYKIKGIDPGNILQEDKYWDLVSVHGKYWAPNPRSGGDGTPYYIPKGKPKQYYTQLPLKNGKWEALSLKEWYYTFDSQYIEKDKNHVYASGAPRNYDGKKMDKLYDKNHVTKSRTGNNDDPLNLFYTGRKPTSYNREHVIPQSHYRLEWTGKSHDDSEQSKRGRGDLHTLRPTNSGYNSARVHWLFGILNVAEPGIERRDNNIDFEKGRPKWLHSKNSNEILIEPRPNIRGNIARMTFYSHDRYHLTYSYDYYKLMILWAILDPVTKEEKAHDLRIKKVMGFSNDYVTGKKSIPYSQEVYEHLKKFNLT